MTIEIVDFPIDSMVDLSIPAPGDVLKFFRPFGKWHFLTKGCDFSFAAWFFPFARPFEGLPYFMGCMKLHHQSLQIHAGTARNRTNSIDMFIYKSMR